MLRVRQGKMTFGPANGTDPMSSLKMGSAIGAGKHPGR
jgi:hypothetical protein